MNSKNSLITSENSTLNATVPARKKIRRWRNWSVDDFDSTKIRLGKSAKFDGAGVCCVMLMLLISVCLLLRNSTVTLYQTLFCC